MRDTEKLIELIDLEEPSCGRHDCEIEKTPSHWVEAELTQEFKLALNELIEAAGDTVQSRDCDCESDYTCSICVLNKKIQAVTKLLHPEEQSTAIKPMKCVSCGDQLENGTLPVTHSENQANDSELLLCVHCKEAYMVQQINDRKKF
jgi:hypothetical protein